MSESQAFTLVLSMDGEERREDFEAASRRDAVHLASMRFQMEITEAEPMYATCGVRAGDRDLGFWAYQGFGHDLVWVPAVPADTSRA
jgi:hypothetical protein